MLRTLERVQEEIKAIDSRVKHITERPFRGEEYELERQEIVDGLMDKRDELVKERTEFERRNSLRK